MPLNPKLPPGVKLNIEKIRQQMPVADRVATAAPKSWYSNKAKPGHLTFYNLKTIPSQVEDPRANDRPCFRVTKFSNDLEAESSYILNYLPSQNGGYYDCNCPATKFDCRHKSIMREFLNARKENTEYFYCFETRTFKKAEEIE
jgi:hypothetical protein